MSHPLKPLLLLCLTMASVHASGQTVSSVEQLIKAVNNGREGATISIAAGTYLLESPLKPKSGMTIRGAGVDKTIISHVPGWKPSTKTLPDPEIKTKGLDSEAYLVRLADKGEKMTISDMTLRAPQLHGLIFGFGNRELSLHDLKLEECLWSGIRIFNAKNSKIHACEFINAGGRFKRGGIPGDDGGISGGAIFTTWMQDTEISHNRIRRTNEGKRHGHYGIKGRGGRFCHIHHNTIEVNFSIEFPFENHEDFEIDHNILKGVVSIPKYAGGTPSKNGGHTFHIHHNYFTTSYAIEFVRNSVEISHNLFDFSLEKDGGNLISAFGKAPAPGPALFHNNLVKNPGRGVIWINEPYNQITVRNNHIIANTTPTPRKEGLFGFNESSDFKSYRFIDNIIECKGLARPLFRNDDSGAATVTNNRLINISDTNRYSNPAVENRKPGLQAPLKFRCGVNGEMQVEGWQARPVD